METVLPSHYRVAGEPSDCLNGRHVGGDVIMKLLVMSDSHRSVSHMRTAAELTAPDAIIHLGDHFTDAQELHKLYPGAAYYAVSGNCDPHSGGKTEMLLILEGVRVFISHGHKYGVKSGLASFEGAARDNGAALALYGHTHQAALRQVPGLWLMNPGQMQRNAGHAAASYGVVNITDGAFECGIEYLGMH